MTWPLPHTRRRFERFTVTTVWPHGDPRDVIRSIERDALYRVPAQSAPQRSWLDVVREWIANLVRAFVHRLDAALGAHNAFETAIGFIVVVAALAVLGFGIYVFVRSALRGTRRTRPGGGSGADRETAQQTSAALRAAARAAARERRYRDAAALLFLSAVRALDESGRIAYDPARTPGEYRRLVRDPLFDAFTGDAVVALFAAAEPHDDVFERMSGAYDRFFASSTK